MLVAILGFLVWDLSISKRYRFGTQSPGYSPVLEAHPVLRFGQGSKLSLKEQFLDAPTYD